MQLNDKIEKRPELKNIDNKTWYRFTPKKSFKQGVKSKVMEFVYYMNSIFNELKKIKIRFPQFDIDKYKVNLKNISIKTIKKIK